MTLITSEKNATLYQA